MERRGTRGSQYGWTTHHNSSITTVNKNNQYHHNKYSANKTLVRDGIAENFGYQAKYIYTIINWVTRSKRIHLVQSLII